MVLLIMFLNKILHDIETFLLPSVACRLGFDVQESVPWVPQSFTGLSNVQVAVVILIR